MTQGDSQSYVPVFDWHKRPVIDISKLCSLIPPNPPDLCITLPGGYQVCASQHRINIGAFSHAKAAIDAANTALAPLGPFFTVMDVVVQLQQTFSAVIDSLGPPLDPTPLVKELKKLAQKMAFLIRLMPIFTVPLMLLNILDMLIATVDGAAAEFKSIARFAQRIQEAQIGVQAAPGLAGLVTCAAASMETQMGNLEHLLASVNPIIQLANTFAKIASVGDPFPIPEFAGQQPPEPLAAAIALEQLSIVLHKYRDLIPI